MSYFSIPLYSRQHFGVFRFPFGSDEGHATTWEDLVWARGDIQTALSSPPLLSFIFLSFLFQNSGNADLCKVEWPGQFGMVCTKICSQLASAVLCTVFNAFHDA